MHVVLPAFDITDEEKEGQDEDIFEATFLFTVENSIKNVILEISEPHLCEQCRVK